MFREIRPNRGSEKYVFFFHMTIRKQTAQGVSFMNERQPNSRDNSAVKTRLLRLMRPSTQRIGKDIRGSSQLFTRRTADVISEAGFTTMTGDRHDELAAIDLSTIEVALTRSCLYASLVIFFIIPVCSLMFLNTKLYILSESWLCSTFITVRKFTI